MIAFSFSTIVKMCLLVAVLMMSSVTGRSYGDNSIFGFHGNDYDNRKASVESSFLDILHNVQRRQADTSDGLFPCNQTADNRAKGQISPHELPVYRHYVFINGKDSHTCGGAVLSEHWIITSGSCLEKLSGKISLVLGYQRPDVGEQTLSVSKILNHHQFNGTAGNNYDMALIKVAPNAKGRVIQFTNLVQPVCLPTIICTPPQSLNCTMIGIFHIKGSVKALVVEDATMPSKQTCIRAGVQVSENQVCSRTNTDVTTLYEGFLGGPVIYSAGGVYMLAGVITSAPQRYLVIVTSTQPRICRF